ncbi:hypothetical protein [Xanthomonas sacchari]|uniref:hypothetical protein n=1 Tax=Xanthomonas sacchari TaxID=56458 RepID=UPI00225DCE32|nr:hypothetical protein [Xanthomonas sacchari]MCW0436159.1 hypothetical protein [Xanthomonas sacchari]
MSDTVWIAASIFASAYLLALFVYMGFRQNLRLREKQLEFETRIRMNEFRSHLEREIMSLNKDYALDIKGFEEINHLAISGQSELSLLSKSRPQQSAFLKAHGIDLSRISIKPRSIFVLTPFHADFDNFFATTSEFGRETNYSVSRGDERVEKSDIFPQILHGIVSSRFIIANITGRNPNVFYELGVAQALDKEVILVAERNAEVPFDIQSKRIIFYDTPAELKSRLATALARLSEV